MPEPVPARSVPAQPVVPPAATSEPLLDVQDLHVRFRTRQGVVNAVDGVSLSVQAGQVLGVVGESGSGKSVTALAVLRLLTSPNVEISGRVMLRGRDLLALPDSAMRSVRGREIAMIMQDPMTALTPVYTAGWHLAQAIRAHEKVSSKAVHDRSVALLREVGIPDPERRLRAYPHQFSGGMRQRLVIAVALSCSPALLIADEPTTALDVTTQAQVLDLMDRLRREHGSSILIITHDMGVVSQLADQVLVMYGGRTAERGSRTDVFHTPLHPYTWGLLGSVPRTDRPPTRRLAAIPGAPISPLDTSPGCRFAARCRLATPRCTAQPPLVGHPGTDGVHEEACWLPLDRRAELREQADREAAEARA